MSLSAVKRKKCANDGHFNDIQKGTWKNPSPFLWMVFIIYDSFQLTACFLPVMKFR